MYIPCDLLNNIFFPLAYFLIRTQYIIHTTDIKWRVNFVISKSPLANSRLLVVKFWGVKKCM